MSKAWRDDGPGSRRATPGGLDDGVTIGHEAELWAMADARRRSMGAAAYRHFILGLIFLKYISDAFEERHAAVFAQSGDDAAETRDAYVVENVFWVPPKPVGRICGRRHGSRPSA